MIEGFTIFLAFQLAGELVARGLELPVPGPVIGLLFLFLVLWFRSATPANLTDAASALHSHLSLLFVPAGVGVMLYSPALAREWLVILVSVVISTLIGLGVTVWVLKALVENEDERQ